MILFGWGHTKDINHGETYPLACPNCKNNIFLKYVERGVYFTLFFIPIFPYKTQHLLLCPICSHGSELNSSVHNEALEMAVITAKYLKDEISKKEYFSNIEKYGKIFFQ